MRLPAGLAVSVALHGLVSDALAQDSRSIRALENAYLSTLDAWVGAGGPVEQLQNEVVATCAKLVVLLATRGERSAFVSTDPEEFDLRLDVCTKITVNRVRPQAQLAEPGVVALICDRGNPLYVRLCERSGGQDGLSNQISFVTNVQVWNNCSKSAIFEDSLQPCRGRNSSSEKRS